MAGANSPGLFVAHGPDVGRIAEIGQKCPGDNDLQERSDKGSSHTGQLPDMLLLQGLCYPPVSLDTGAGFRTLRLLLNRLGGFRSQCVPRSPPERYPPRAIPSPSSRSHAPRPHRRTALSRRRCCQSASTPAIQQTYIPTIRLTYAECRRVTDGARTRDLRSHNPTTSVSTCCRCCRIGLSKPISLLTVAHCFCVLRSGWCQRWCQSVSPTTTVVCLVAPRTSSGAATLFSIESEPCDYPRATTREKASTTPPRPRRSTHDKAFEPARDSACPASASFLKYGTQKCASDTSAVRVVVPTPTRFAFRFNWRVATLVAWSIS